MSFLIPGPAFGVTRRSSPQIYDPASGTRGMLSVAKEHLLERAQTPEERARVALIVIPTVDRRVDKR
jgi:hypothetical protein